MSLFKRYLGEDIRYHIAIPEGQRFTWKNFVGLKNLLVNRFGGVLNKNLYSLSKGQWVEESKPLFTKDQPVYEYTCSFEDLREAISGYAKEKMGIEDDTFKEVDYDFVDTVKTPPIEGENVFVSLKKDF